MLLNLSNGMEWSVRGTDRSVTPFLNLLAKAMQLEEGRASPHCISVRPVESFEEAVAAEDEVLIPRSSLNFLANSDVRSKELVGLQICRIASAVARGIQKHHGLLIHAALAEWNGCGVLFAAPGGTGKTTVSRRLPAPWRSLCDDACLAVPVGGKFRVHPWPTWSRFYWGGAGGSWNVPESLPLRAVFFLKQADQERVEPLTKVEAAAELAESNGQIMQVDWERLSLNQQRELRIAGFHHACDLAKETPAFKLHLSLTGSFWTPVEEILEKL